MSIRTRIAQRKLWQWELAYLAGAWLFYQAARLVGENFGWPRLREHSTTLFLTGDIAGAASVTERAITLAPDAVGNYVRHAEVQFAQGQPRAATMTLRDGMRILGTDRFATELTNRMWTRRDDARFQQLVDRP